MKVLVFGSREWVQEGMIYRVLSKLPKGTILVNGGARGADLIADRIGRQLGFDVRCYLADWNQHGKAAGPIRNRLMIEKEHPDAQGLRIDKAFGFSTGRENKGTHDMAEVLWENRIRVEILFPAELPV